MASTPVVQTGDIVHVANKEIINISSNPNNFLAISNIGKISSITSGLNVPVTSSSTSYTSCSLDTNYSSNDRSGAVIITWTGTGIFSSSVPRGSVVFSNRYTNIPKVTITPYDSLAITGGGNQLHYYVKTTATGFGIYTNNDGDIGQIEKFFYIVEE